MNARHAGKTSSTKNESSHRPLSILLVGPNTLRVNTAGIEQALFYLAQFLLQKKQHVELFCTSPEPKGSLNYEGIPVHEFPRFAPQHAYYFSPALARAIGESKHEIIHAYGYNNMATMAAVWMKKPGQKLIITGASSISSSAFRKLLHAPLGWYYRLFRQKIDKLICVSPYEYALFKDVFRLPEEKYVVIPNGIELESLKKMKKKRVPHMILSVGRLVKQKGMHRLIAAMPEVLHAHPDARLHIVGGGPERDALELQSKKLGVSAAVTFHGHIQFEEKSRLMELFSQAEVFSLMADSESQGLVYGMGIATRCKVLTTNQSAMKELVQAGAALGIDHPDDSHAIASGIIQLFNSPLPKIEMESLLWSWERVGNAVLGVYRELCGQKP